MSIYSTTQIHLNDLLSLPAELQRKLQEFATSEQSTDDALNLLKEAVAVAVGAMTESQIDEIIADVEDYGLIDATTIDDQVNYYANKDMTFEERDFDENDDEFSYLGMTILLALGVQNGFVEKLTDLFEHNFLLHENIDYHTIEDVCTHCYASVMSTMQDPALAAKYYVFVSTWRIGDVTGEDRQLYKATSTDRNAALTHQEELEQASWAVARDLNNGKFDEHCYGQPCFDVDGFIVYPSDIIEVTAKKFEVLASVGMSVNHSGNIDLFDINAAMVDENDDVSSHDAQIETFSVLVDNIVYDEGHDLLPTEMELTFECRREDLEMQLVDGISDKISEITGFCVKSYTSLVK
ncbi:hypothetical protein [Shewanella aestuarii]|uniref:Uncharacterized protein n=1 Tax=Shewanella aestuarii TaxID=1028752 RepID=A0A6G9QQ79_9GAMM|nr:hypothetical protein [Shewanella aestuarii]QIR16622.1 hypothetical protein HBH39_19290 [Shewanella aestuarii]